jgi:hypothetical protein
VGGHDAVLSPLWALVPVAGSLSWSWGSLWSTTGTPAPLAAHVHRASGSSWPRAWARWLFALGPGRLPQVECRRHAGGGAWAALAYLARSARCSASAPTSTCCGATRRRSWPRIAFVNPIVAMLLGTLVGGESLLAPRTLSGPRPWCSPRCCSSPPRPPAARTRRAPTAGVGPLPARRPLA